MKRIYFFLGTTAELIKISPVLHELKRRKVPFKIIASNQNELHFKELYFVLGKTVSSYTFQMKIPAWIKDVYFRFVIWLIKSLGNYFLYFNEQFRGHRKDIVFVVHGDTVTALVGSIVAKLNFVKLVHIESGLRSFNLFEPVPEEVSRLIISYLANVHFAPNSWARRNLKRHPGTKIITSGNTIADTLKLAKKRLKNIKIKSIGRERYFILVLHRQEHTLFDKARTNKLIKLMTSRASSDFKCVFIMHKLTKDYLEKQKLYDSIRKNKNVVLPLRLPYLEFIKLLKGSEFIATDGGSNQEEAFYLGKPCLILRNTTERIEGLGENAILAGSFVKIEKFLKYYKRYKRKPIRMKHSPSKVIVDYLMSDGK